MLFLAFSTALAASPEVDALARQVQRGLAPEATVQVIAGLPPLDSDAVVQLLRAGAAAITLADAGYAPTDAQVQEAERLGALVLVSRAAETPSVRRSAGEQGSENDDESTGGDDWSLPDRSPRVPEVPTSDDLTHMWRVHKTSQAFAGVGLGLSAIGCGIILTQAPKGGDLAAGAVIGILGTVSLGISWVL